MFLVFEALRVTHTFAFEFQTVKIAIPQPELIPRASKVPIPKSLSRQQAEA